MLGIFALPGLTVPLLILSQGGVLFDESLVLSLQPCDDLLGAFEEFLVTFFELLVLLLKVLAVDLELLLVLQFRD